RLNHPGGHTVGVVVGGGNLELGQDLEGRVINGHRIGEGAPHVDPDPDPPARLILLCHVRSPPRPTPAAVCGSSLDPVTAMEPGAAVPGDSGAHAPESPSSP